MPDDSTKSGYRPPHAGELFKNPDFAQVLRTLGSGGAEAFYTGELVSSFLTQFVCGCRVCTHMCIPNCTAGYIGQAIVDVVQELGGALTMEDLAGAINGTDYPDAMCVNYHGVDVW